jgi:hypothetical protein
VTFTENVLTKILKNNATRHKYFSEFQWQQEKRPITAHLQ